MASLTQTSVSARKIIRFGIYAIILIIIGRFLLRGAVILYRRIFPAPPPKPTVAFGKLPVLPFPEKNKDRKFTFSLELPEGKLPVLPQQEEVYFMPPFESNIAIVDDAKALANRLGFDPEGKPIVESVPNVYVFQKRNGLSTLTMNIITGIFSINYNINADPQVISGTPPAPDSAMSQASSYLHIGRLLSTELKDGRMTTEFLKLSGGIFSPVSSLSEADAIKVNVFRKNYGKEGNISSITPDMPEANIWFVIAGGQRKEIIAAEYNHYPLDAGRKATYPLKTSESAFEQLKANKGFIPNAPAQDNIIIRRVYLGYYDPGQYAQYYQPVVVFEGDNNFFGFVPAVADDFYGEVEAQNGN